MLSRRSIFALFAGLPVALGLTAGVSPASAEVIPAALPDEARMLLSHGGVRGLLKRTVTASYELKEYPPGIDIVNEIKTALNQEGRAELMCDLYRRARKVQWVGRWTDDPKVGSPALSKLIRDESEKLGGDKRLAVVSPIVLTVIQCEPLKVPDHEERAPFVRTADPFKGDDYQPVGYLTGNEGQPNIDLYIDQYASDREPVILAKDDWFSFDFNDGLSLVEDDTNIELSSDYNVMPNHRNIRLIDINMWLML